MGFTTRRKWAALAALLAVACAGCSREALLGPDEPDLPSAQSSAHNASALDFSNVEPSPQWTPQVRTLETTKASLHELYENPGCESAATVADRLETTWDLWFGRTTRTNQPEYEPLVLDPVARFTVQCGRTFAEEVVARLDDPDGALQLHIDKVAASKTMVDVSDHATDTPTE